MEKPKKSSIESESRTKARPVMFKLEAPADVVEVLVAGDFTGWCTKAMKMKRQKNGTWMARTWLPSGRHEYRFIVNGQWIDDPRCNTRVPNPYGSENCVLEIP